LPRDGAIVLQFFEERAGGLERIIDGIERMRRV
jgi:hypothetical protein